MQATSEPCWYHALVGCGPPPCKVKEVCARGLACVVGPNYDKGIKDMARFFSLRELDVQATSEPSGVERWPGVAPSDERKQVFMKHRCSTCPVVFNI